MEVDTSPPSSIPPAESASSTSSFIENVEQPQQQQQQQQNKRKASEADLGHATATNLPPLLASPSSSPTTPNDGLASPPPPPIITRHGACLETAITLDSSSDEEDETDVPVDSLVAATATSVPAYLIPGAAAAPTASRVPASVPARHLLNLAPAVTTPAGFPTTNGKPAAAAAAATAASAAGGAAGLARILGGAASFAKASAVASAAAATAAMNGGDASTSYGPQAVGAGYSHHANGGTYGVKYENGGGGGGGAGSSPSMKRKIAAHQRRAGRPIGSKSRPDDEDTPYLAPNPPQRGIGTSFVPNAADRPRRQSGPRRRWADEMMNPGEQWLRKTPKHLLPLPPNPVDASIIDAPTFYPTPEEFRDPLSYVESIRPTAERYGIAKIVPPKGWKPPPTPMNLHHKKRVPTKKQALHSLMNSDEVYDDGQEFNIVDYKRMADKFQKNWENRQRPEPKPRALPHFEPMSPKLETPRNPTAAEVDEAVKENDRLRNLEREYWNVVDGGVEEIEVEYANDLNISDFWSGFPMPPKDFMDGSSFDRTKPCDFDDPEYYRTCGWNLNNIPFWPGSVLRFFRTHVNGLTAPWLYLGMQYATFAWHNEDNYLYSLNYHHSGAAKQWYGVPGNHAKGFEKCLAKNLGETLETVQEHLYRITKMLSPVYLLEAHVPVSRLEQHAGQFVVTFPKAYHGGFSYGFNCGEAVNFAVPDWISYSRESTEAYRSASRMAALSHDKMVATLTMYLPDHDVKGCELVVRELRRIHAEELEHRSSLERKGVQDPARQGVPLPRFRLGLIERDTEEYDERRVCKTCKHTLFMTGVACPCSDVDVSCLRCVKEACACPVSSKYLLSWWTEDDLSRFVKTAETYLRKLRDGQADQAAIAAFRANINPF